ncbi:hypothetical protein [Georgenia faecalis]|uniref:Integral membrane protein n=1 Tax=Georgenia faecalis TaxID=2483799 RepID=A0ABV9D9B1_9MICO|nr:hypothetical protein [Georgenia faecalis]
METETEPEDVRIARAVRTLRDAVVGAGAACLVLGVFAVAVVLLLGADDAWPAVTLLGGGQVLAIVAAAVAALALRAVLAGAEPTAPLERAWRGLRLTARAVLVLCVLAAVAWVVADPGSAVSTVALALVTAQLTAVLTLLARRVRSSAGAR